MTLSRSARWLAALAFALPITAPAQEVVLDGHPCILRVEDPGESIDQGTLLRTAPHTVTRVGGGATFEVTYTGFTPEAEAAFQRAVDIWSDHLESSVVIRVNAQFGPLNPGVLGSAGPRNAYGNRPQFPLQGTLYPDALADALAGSSLGGTNPDINATFSSTFPSFYFGLDGDPPANQYDFVTVVLHELGHGLGFVGSARADDGQPDPNGGNECTGTAGDGCWGFNGLPIIFDRFVEDGMGVLFLDEDVYPNPSQELGALLISDDLFFDGVTVTTTYDNMPQPVFGPNPFQGGSSYSHWDEAAFPRGTSEALMTPFIARNEAHADPGLNTCALFADLGWPLGPGCLFLVDDEAAPALASGGLRVVSQNPGRGAARLTVSLAGAVSVRAELTDILGRTLAVLHDGAAPAGELVLRTPDGLAPGAYLVRVQTPGGVEAARLVRL